MAVKLMKVEGGYQLFISDELAARVGLDERATVEVQDIGSQLMVWSVEHKKAEWERMMASIDSDDRPVEVGWGAPVGKERFWEEE